MAVKYGFVVAIGSALDLATHVIASTQLRMPETYADSFDVLAEAGLVSEDLARRLGGMAGFRNLLVHQYHKVDDKRVVSILHGDLDDLDEFRRVIARAIDA